MSHIIYLARGTVLDASADDVQILPPGTHTISPMRADDGQPVELTVTLLFKA